MKLRNITADLLVLLLALGTTACAAPAEHTTTGYTDVSPGDWFYDAVTYCQAQGLMAGTSPTHFDPQGSMTRAMLSTALYRQAGSPAVNGSAPFTDTDGESWYASAVLWAYQQGIITGYTPTRFGPDNPVTREQLVTILHRQAGSPTASNGIPFADQDRIAPYAVNAVAWARERGTVSGKEGNRFVPQGTATRAEVATILRNHANSETPEPSPDSPRVLIAYFSCTNNTANIAQHIQSALPGATLFQLTPAQPYTADDLNYSNDSCRANREQQDPAARPALSGRVDGMETYDVVFLGYPIWWGQPPKIIYSFLESYDFHGKTVIPFCTSGSSGYSDAGIRDIPQGADWHSGQRFSGGATQGAVQAWVDGLALPSTPDNPPTGEERDTVTLTANGTSWTATLVENSSTAALKERLGQGPLTIAMHDYGSMEKVGPLGFQLPTNDQPTDTQAGDLILYQGNQLALYYGTNHWNFTRLGKLDGVSREALLEVLGHGDVEITLDLGA